VTFAIVRLPDRPIVDLAARRSANQAFTWRGAELRRSKKGAGTRMSGEPIVDQVVFERARAALGADFVRILGYFLEDGAKSVADIAAAFHGRTAARLVTPAHKLKGEARQLGAMAIGELAFVIEMGARRAVETQSDPTELLVPIAKLQPLWDETVVVLERETNPLVQRAPRAAAAAPVASGGFGRALPTNQRFGRL
jgi:histidine phosphotransfer protein HptB